MATSPAAAGPPFASPETYTPRHLADKGSKLSRRTGKREQAREHLTTAATMYCEMDMRFWREQAEAEAAGLN